MAQRLGGIKEQLLDLIARGIAERGFVVLLHDHRNLGGGTGTPRGDVNPWDRSPACRTGCPRSGGQDRHGCRARQCAVIRRVEPDRAGGRGRAGEGHPLGIVGESPLVSGRLRDYGRERRLARAAFLPVGTTVTPFDEVAATPSSAVGNSCHFPFAATLKPDAGPA
jgi:hypothetical protein